jgi:dihydrofolate reductase
MLISLIAAMTPEHVIGLNGKLPWHVPEDLKHFKTLTTGRTVLMGRKTFDSIRKPLPNRTNLILSRRIPPQPPSGTQWFTKLQEAIATAERSGESELFIVGGAEIYALAMPLADRMYISIIKLQDPVSGDTWFPKWDPAQWRAEHREQRPNVEFITYRREPWGPPQHRIKPMHEPGV